MHLSQVHMGIVEQAVNADLNFGGALPERHELFVYPGLSIVLGVSDIYRKETALERAQMQWAMDTMPDDFGGFDD